MQTVFFFRFGLQFRHMRFLPNIRKCPFIESPSPSFQTAEEKIYFTALRMHVIDSWCSFNFFDAVNSLDVPGLMGRSVADLTAYFQMLAGWDPLDSTSLRPAPHQLQDPERRLRIGVPQEYVCQGMSPEVIEALSHVCDIFDSDGNRDGIPRFCHIN